MALLKRRIDFFFVKSQGGGIRTKDCRSNENSFDVAHCCPPPANRAALVQQQDVICSTIWRFPCAPILPLCRPGAPVRYLRHTLICRASSPLHGLTNQQLGRLAQDFVKQL